MSSGLVYFPGSTGIFQLEVFTKMFDYEDHYGSNEPDPPTKAESQPSEDSAFSEVIARYESFRAGAVAVAGLIDGISLQSWGSASRPRCLQRIFCWVRLRRSPLATGYRKDLPTSLQVLRFF